MQQDALIHKQLGAYLVQAKLGEGGMARVYKAYHARLRRDVAIKVILSQKAHESDFQARFEREAQLIASLEHPNIVAVYDFGEVDQLTYLVMQYVGGGTLREQMTMGQPMDARRAAHYMVQMARALHHAHQRGVVHRDVKPQNMLVSSSDPRHLLLSDFGIAKLFDGSADDTRPYEPGTTAITALHNPSLTSTDQIIGTAQYMAPEQVRREMVDARTDVYALGVVLFQLLTGQMPFDGTTSAALMYQQAYVPPKTVRLVNPGVPDALGQIAAMALEKVPAARFQTAEAMARALESFISSPAPSITAFTPSQPFSPGNQTLPWGSPTTNQGPSSPMISTPASYMPSSYAQSTANQPLAPATELSQHRTHLLQPNTNNRPAPITNVPTTQRTHATGRIRTIISLAVLLLVIGVTLYKLLPAASSHQGRGNPPSTTAAQPFTDTFTSNDRNWPNGTIDGLTATLDATKHAYQLSVSDGNAYFPTPASVGTLPKNYTFSATIKQTAGNTTDTSSPHGLAFNMTYSGNTMQSGYVFAIYDNGICALLRYDNSTLNTTFTQQYQSSSIKANSPNTITATIHGSTFTFRINGTPLGNGTPQTYTDPTYTSGHLGLYAGGNGSSFTITRVSLAF